MLLEAVEPADRVGASLVEDLGVVAGEERRRTRLVRTLTLLVALVVDLERVVALEVPASGDAVAGLELQAVVLALAVVAVGPETVRERAELDAVQHHVRRWPVGPLIPVSQFFAVLSVAPVHRMTVLMA